MLPCREAKTPLRACWSTASASSRTCGGPFSLMIAASSSVQIKSSTGATIAASWPVNDPSDQQVVIVRLKRALPPGTYKVSWDVVTIDQRQASGAYLFTVS
jgi:methionine-rich copper-binding protein CopC